MLARILTFLSGPPIDGLKGHWPVSRRGPERRRPALLARDNIYNVV